jgi:hypothetical protein
MIRRSILICCAFVGVAGLSVPAACQTFTQTAAYILNGGMVDLKDMKQIDEERVQVPSWMFGATTLMPAMVVSGNRATCEAIMEIGDKRIQANFNNIIFKETRITTAGSNFGRSVSLFYLIGENPVACVEYKGNKSCQREWDTSAYSDNLPRIHNALKYLVDNFCAGANRKSAF